MLSPGFDIRLDQIKDFCHRWKIREFAFFGSVLRADFRPDSDIDVLVRFQEDAPWSLFELVAMEDELSLMWGRQVDLVEQEGLRNPYRRQAILRQKEVVYAP